MFKILNVYYTSTMQGFITYCSVTRWNWVPVYRMTDRIVVNVYKQVHTAFDVFEPFMLLKQHEILSILYLQLNKFIIFNILVIEKLFQTD